MDGAVSGLLDSDPDKRESAMQELAHLIEARESDEGQGTLTERILRQIERHQNQNQNQKLYKRPPYSPQIKPDLITNIFD